MQVYSICQCSEQTGTCLCQTSEKMYARHCRKSQGASHEGFLQKPKVLGNKCNFKDVTALQCKKTAIKNAYKKDKDFKKITNCC